MRRFENIKRDLGPGSCSWFLSTEPYQDWLGLGERSFDARVGKDPGRVLSILGIRSSNPIYPLI